LSSGLLWRQRVVDERAFFKKRLWTSCQDRSIIVPNRETGALKFNLPTGGHVPMNRLHCAFQSLWTRSSSKTASKRQQKPSYQPVLERFEDRLSPADIRFINAAGGDWNVPANWDLGRVPIAADDAIIDIAGITVTHLTGTHAVRSVNSVSNFTISGGTLEISDSLTTTASLQVTASTLAAGRIVAPSLSVTSNGQLTSLTSTTTQMHKLEVQVSGTLSVDASSRIDVTGKGYREGRTTGNVPSGSDTGSYGGRGGSSSNAVYGDYANPNDWGSGGTTNPFFAGVSAGGGLVRISAASMILNGQLIANGQSPAFAGSASGGGIYLAVTTLSGSGRIDAAGGTSNSGGGGGRLAVYAQDYSAFTLSLAGSRLSAAAARLLGAPVPCTCATRTSRSEH
jgi:hypothetical protein